MLSRFTIQRLQLLLANIVMGNMPSELNIKEDAKTSGADKKMLEEYIIRAIYTEY